MAYASQHPPFMSYEKSINQNRDSKQKKKKKKKKEEKTAAF